ncbi:MAG: disulfide reductase [Calditrichaeota bacterium]|nr:disulfide reductase [Calditrichota bacterium]
MEFAYYPGCSLEHTGKPYDQSVREVFKALGITLREIEDWNCCGATMYMSINKTIAYSVSARNLAIAQHMGCDICAPCNSCYTILRKTNRYIAWDPKVRAKILTALKAADLTYEGQVNVRHPLDILVNDVGLDTIEKRAKNYFDGLKVAPYYGCQIVRPVKDFDELDDPMTMDYLLSALGANVVPFADKIRCCGGMLMTTYEEIALDLNNELLLNAEESGAEIIATTCPLCQMNLEGYQAKINEKYQTNHQMPIVYFTQLLGLALGIEPKKLGMDSLVVTPTNLKLKSKDMKVAA